MTEEGKRLEEAADRFAYKKWLNTAYPLRKVDCKIDFKAGAEYGYKEAIAQAKEWLKERIGDDIFFCIDGWLTSKEFLIDFETDMNKLLEGKQDA